MRCLPLHKQEKAAASKSSGIGDGVEASGNGSKGREARTPFQNAIPGRAASRKTLCQSSAAPPGLSPSLARNSSGLGSASPSLGIKVARVPGPAHGGVAVRALPGRRGPCFRLAADTLMPSGRSDARQGTRRRAEVGPMHGQRRPQSREALAASPRCPQRKGGTYCAVAVRPTEEGKRRSGRSRPAVAFIRFSVPRQLCARPLTSRRRSGSPSFLAAARHRPRSGVVPRRGAGSRPAVPRTGRNRPARRRPPGPIPPGGFGE